MELYIVILVAGTFNIGNGSLRKPRSIPPYSGPIYCYVRAFIELERSNTDCCHREIYRVHPYCHTFEILQKYVRLVEARYNMVRAFCQTKDTASSACLRGDPLSKSFSIQLSRCARLVGSNTVWTSLGRPWSQCSGQRCADCEKADAKYLHSSGGKKAF